MKESELYFDKGTLIIKHLPEKALKLFSFVKWDERTHCYRAPAYYYRNIVLELRQQQFVYKDYARQFQPQPFPLKTPLLPRSYQSEALDHWLEQGARGVVTMPTGSGKTILAVLGIQKIERPALIHVPTIDLMHQWHMVLEGFFGQPIGLLGGGYKEIHPLTIATYDSALLHVSSKGNRFGLAIFDECHHLPGAQYQYTAISSIAPFRLGLTATPERTDGKEERLYHLVGPLCYEVHIDELENRTLAPYEVLTIPLELTAEERTEYEKARKCYTDFLSQHRINMSHPKGWNIFLWKSSRNAEGKKAFKAYLAQKQLSQAAQAKEAKIWELISRHRGDRIIIFTQDNEMAYRIGKQFFLPVLTHHTKLKEREAFLKAFREGVYSILVTSKVLNEGVDVPEANVAIIVSGSGSVREHVQRLGRILRGRPGKKAYLYELVTRGTGEHFINKRRRQHRAYQRSRSV